MFNMQDIRPNEKLIPTLKEIVPEEHKRLGCLIGKSEKDVAIAVIQANYRKVKNLPKGNLSIFETTDLGIGYSKVVSIRRLNELIEVGKFKRNTPIHLKYRFGNVFAYIYIQDTDINFFRTDEMYFFVHNEDKTIWNVTVGKPVNPNHLYYRQEFDNRPFTVDELCNITGMNSVYLVEDQYTSIP